MAMAGSKVHQRHLRLLHRVHAVAVVQHVARLHLEDVVAAHEKAVRRAGPAHLAGEAIGIRRRRRLRRGGGRVAPGWARLAAFGRKRIVAEFRYFRSHGKRSDERERCFGPRRCGLRFGARLLDGRLRPVRLNEEWQRGEKSETPLQVTYANGCIISDWFDPVVDHPAALMPFTAPASTYQVSMEGYPAPFAAHYVGIGFTDSAILYSNLETSAKAWLRLKPNANLDGFTVVYELRLDGMNGPLLASGEVPSLGFNQMALRYDPAAQMIGATLNGMELGWYPLVMSAPKFVGFEGVGILDDFVVRRLP